MKNLTILSVFLSASICFIGCSPATGKFIQSSNYERTQNLQSVYLVVIGSKETNQCFDYLEDFLKDSLINKGLKVDSRYYCCRDKNTDVAEVMSEIVPSPLKNDHVLTVVITKAVVGHGTSSSRELVVSLYDASQDKITWTGKLRASFQWFVSDANYRNVAKKINQLILEELSRKEILK